jgi:HSP20 family protein
VATDIGEKSRRRKEVVAMLMRFDPFRELDRLVEQVWGPTTLRSGTVAMDAYRLGDHFVARFDLPGVRPDSIDLTVEKNVLTVSAERQDEPADGAEVLVAERPHGSFTRQLFLGEALDTEHVEASYEDGVLTVTIPVAEEARPRRVAITTGGQKAIAAGQAA